MKTIDLRSDTVTLPSDEMREAILNAPLGDDVIDIDPTVEELQNEVARLLGKEAAIFMPSGTMTNQIAIRIHCQPGDEIICESSSHIFNYEQAAYAQLSGVATRTVDGHEKIMKLSQLEKLIRPDNEHVPQTRLLTLENTHNMGGGRVLPFDETVEICKWASSNGLKTHLDGARLFNAVVASGIPAKDWCEHFDTVSICFSKGLGAPVGSALAGNEDDIRKKARRHRKLFGGGMRQAGIIAAGALFAIRNNVQRLATDHEVAKIIANAIEQAPGLSLDPQTVDTNIVVFKVDEQLCDASTFVEKLNEVGVRTYPFSHCHVRAVTHMHISREDAQVAGERIQEIAESASAAA